MVSELIKTARKSLMTLTPGWESLGLKFYFIFELGYDIRRSTGIRTRVLVHVEAERVLLRVRHQARVEATSPSVQRRIGNKFRKIVRR